MSRKSETIVVIRAGIAGLCAAVYALKCAYRVVLLEMQPLQAETAAAQGYGLEPSLAANLAAGVRSKS